MPHFPFLHTLRRICAALSCLVALPLSAAPYVYVANGGNGTVAVFDTVTRQLVTTVPVGGGPFPIAVSPDGTRVVVGNGGSNTVSVIETGGHTVIATIPVGQNPYGIAINPAGTRAFVANYDTSNVSVINLATNQVVTTVAAGLNSGGVAVNPAGTRVYVTNGGDDSISVIDAATNAVITTIGNVGTSPWGIVFSPNGQRAYVANYASNDVSVIDTTTNTRIAQWPVGNGPAGIALNGDGSRLYTANSASDTVSIVDTTAGFPLNNLPVGHRPFGVATHPDGRMLYASNAGDGLVDGSVSVFDGAANVVVATIPAGRFVGSIGNFVSPYTPPGVPGSVAAAPGNQRATVTFTAPFYDGGLSIDSYTATCGSVSHTGPSSPLVVEPLTNGTPVTCTVFATNTRGNGAPSAPVSVTPRDAPSAPGAPTLIAATRGVGAVSLQFDAPASNGGADIGGYTASCQPDNHDLTGPASPLVVEGLDETSTYTCHVSAYNTAGTGPASNALQVAPRPATDLAISVSNGTGFVQGGSDVVYTVQVNNAGPNGVTGARVVDNAGSNVGTPTWTCAASGGAQCPASGSGNVDFLADLPAGASLAITLRVPVPALPETPLTNSASISVPAAWRDTNATNDSATDGPDARGIFRSGFE